MATGKRIVASDGTVTEPNGFVYVQRPGNGEKPVSYEDIHGVARAHYAKGGITDICAVNDKHGPLTYPSG